MAYATIEGVEALAKSLGESTTLLSTENETRKEEINTNTSDIDITEEGLTQTYEQTTQNTSDIDVALAAIAELYEMIGGTN